MKARLILAIISTLLEEMALVAIVLWALPQIGIRLPLPALIAAMVVWGAYSITIYRMGSRALYQKPVVTLPDMVGSEGKVVKALDPEGMVRIKGELWVATSVGGELKTGTAVIVVGQERLKLVVRESRPAGGAEKAE